MGDGLFDQPTKRRWTGGRDLVVLDRDRCPSCGEQTESETVDEPALLRHGGYGEVRSTTRRHCRCGWTQEARIESTNPRRLT